MKKDAKLPHCLNPECSDKHFFKDCTKTPDAVKKTLLEDYRAKRQAQGGKISAITGKETEPEPKARPTPLWDRPAVMLAELHGHRFACRIDSGTDAVAISDTIVKYLGGRGFFPSYDAADDGKHSRPRRAW